MKTLEEIDQLEQSKYGRPRPRHGLKLLYWFANDCLSLDQNNVLQMTCYPQNGDFGFHKFENRYEVNGFKLLPDVPYPYYVVGNLSYLQASKFPSYVTEDYTHSQDNSNTDRVIVSVDDKWFHTVYVTQHRDRSTFSKHATYLISKHLIRIIRGLTLEEFLLKTRYSRPQTKIFPSIPEKAPTLRSNQEPSCPNLPTTSNSIPAITSSTNQDICIEIESQPTVKNNDIQLNNFAQDNTGQILNNPKLQPLSQDNQTSSTWAVIATSSTWISNLPRSSQDNQTTSTCPPTFISSRNQDTDIESSPVSQTNSCVVTDDPQPYPTNIFALARHCNCTIL